MEIIPVNRKFIQLVKGLLLVCCSMALTSCAHESKYSFEKIGNCNYQVQTGDFSVATTYEEAAKQKDRNYALWDNQLGSIYLAEGDNEKALDSFLEAHYLMNNIPAFKELERKAVSLTGPEDNKAYKGDPYEKAMNSLYVGLLLYDKGDFENAIAAFKTGILADSDSKEDSYKSDIAILYLLVSRIAKKIGDESLSNDYLNAVKELFNNPNYSILGFDETLINKMLDLKNNVLLVVEFGEGPFKTRSGQYGELAVIYGYNYDINGWNIMIDGKVNPDNQIYSNTDVYLQASTRGGRKMDGILKGKAQFKTNAANTSVAMLEASNQIMDQANAVRAANPYADTTGYALAAGVTALFAGGAAIMSAITNPKADIRYWSLLPEHINIFPLFISPGKHNIVLEFIDKQNSQSVNGEIAAKSYYGFDIDIPKEKDNVIFKRILRYKVSNKPGFVTQKSDNLSDKSIGDENVFNKLINKFKSYFNRGKTSDPSNNIKSSNNTNN